jgi:hypothetical protein
MDSFQFYCTTIICSVFVIFGGFGNIISIVIFKTKEFKGQTITVYLISACLMNIVTILHLPVMMVSSEWIISTTSCKLFGGFFILITEFQAWITAMGSFDRLITVMMPFKYLFKNKLKFQLSAMASVLGIIFCMIFPYMYFYGVETKIDNTTRCALPPGPQFSWILPYFKFQTILFRYVLPFLIMIISSILIVWKVRRLKSKLKNKSRNTNHRREIQLAKSLVASDIFFIIFRLPVMLYLVSYTKNDDRLIYNYTFSLLLALATVNNVFIFVVLSVFNKVYRDVFFRFFRFRS